MTTPTGRSIFLTLAAAAIMLIQGLAPTNAATPQTSLPSQSVAEALTEIRRAGMNMKVLMGARTSLSSGACGDSNPNVGEECDDGNTTDGDGCAANCTVEAGFDCSPAVPAVVNDNVVTDGSLENANFDGDWTIIDHSLFGELICGDSCFGEPLASDIDGNTVSGNYFFVSGGSFSDASTGTIEHAPIAIPTAGTALKFNYGITTRALTGNCPGLSDGLALLIDGAPIWTSLDEAPANQCVGVDLYSVVDIDLAALGLNDGGLHTIRFEGVSSQTIGPLPGSEDDDLTNIFLDQVRIVAPAQDPQPATPSICDAVVCGDGAFPTFSAAGSEECDDGNLNDGDGCSSVCTIEQPDFVCDDPIPSADENNLVQDGGLEGGVPNGDWTQSDAGNANTLFAPICSQVRCGAALAEDGAWYAWFGGSSLPNFQFIEQAVVIPDTADTLDFSLLVTRCDSPDDTLSVLVDDIDVYVLSCTGVKPVYTPQTADISAFADGDLHIVRFEGNTVATNGGSSNFYTDNIRLGDNTPFAGSPSQCRALDEATTIPEQFENGIPPSWTVINLSPNAADGWGVSDDGLCASQNWAGGNASNNVTGGGGVSACADSDAIAQEMDTYLCTPDLDFTLLSEATPSLSFLANYQAADNSLNDNGTPDDFGDDFDDDFLTVVAGTTFPTPLTIAGYQNLGTVFDHLDTTLDDSPAASVTFSLADFEFEDEVYACFHYRGTSAWFAQIDNVAVRNVDFVDPACAGLGGDGDADDICDLEDNCLFASNSMQVDTDNDGFGNACDADLNQDCIVNVIDLGIFRTLFFQSDNGGDLNGDGITNVIDLGIFRTLFFQAPGPSATGQCD